MQNVLPKIKTYSPRKKTFKSSLCVADFTVSSPNFIRNEPFDTQNEDISSPDHSALHLDHKYL